MFLNIQSLLEFLVSFLAPVWKIVKFWWWLPLPFILWRPFSFFWLWRRRELWLKTVKVVLLEIKVPKEIIKPVRAMETVMAGLRQIIYKPPDWWEKWIDGEVQLSYSLEIASIEGKPHFFIRIPSGIRNSVESVIYSQYPDAEISEVDDYTKLVPQDIPNKNWDFWAADYKLLKPDAYPIKTYLEFETERETKEEKRIDPMSALLESMSKIKPGEHLWVQIIAEPVANADIPWITKAKEEVAKLVKREVKKPPKPIILEAADVLISGGASANESDKRKEIIPPEMKLTPGERDIVSAIEKKISKPGFKTSIRFVYLGKKNIFDKNNLRLPFSYFVSFSTENLNYLVPAGDTMTKIHKSWFLPLNLIRERRVYLRKRRMFIRYVKRLRPFFPGPDSWPLTFVLNIEELASLFHFPGRSYAPAPSFERLEAKKGEAPPDLPTA